LENGDNWNSNPTYNGVQYIWDSVSNTWYLCYDGVDYAQCTDPRGDTDYTYYQDDAGDQYSYDNIAGTWAVYVISGGINYYAPFDGPPEDPGSIIGGDYNSPQNNPTDYDYYYAGGTGIQYRYDNLSGYWSYCQSFTGAWEFLGDDAPSDAGILTGGDNWVDHTVNGSPYAEDSVIGAWYSYNSGTGGWSSCADPNQGGSGILTVGSLLVNYNVSVTGNFYVENDFSIGGTPFNPSDLSPVSDGNGNFLGWQLDYGSLQDGDDASFTSLTATNGMDVAELYGNVSVAGSLGLGTWSNGSQNFTGLPLGAPVFAAASPAATWHWQQDGVGSSADQMTFDYSTSLNLFSHAGSTQHALSLDPGSLALTTQINNGNVTTLNLISDSVAASTTVLNLGGGIYLDAGARSLRLGNATVTGSDNAGALVFTDSISTSTIAISPAGQSVAFSNGLSLASNNTSITFVPGGVALALGGNATASGNNAVAMAGGAASGVLSMALGSGSTASGNGSLALGASSVASGNGSIALIGGNASANNAIAIGQGTSAQTWGTTVVGHYNAPISGNATGFSAGDPALIVGVGANATTEANALVIYNNGNSVASGNVTLANPSYVSPTSSTQPQEIQVNGTTLFNAGAMLNGAVIIATPSGGLPMGAYGN
jgi:hypothetical protein